MKTQQKVIQLFGNISAPVSVSKQNKLYLNINTESYLYQKEFIKRMHVFMTAGFCQILLLIAVEQLTDVLWVLHTQKVCEW